MDYIVVATCVYASAKDPFPSLTKLVMAPGVAVINLWAFAGFNSCCRQDEEVRAGAVINGPPDPDPKNELPSHYLLNETNISGLLPGPVVDRVESLTAVRELLSSVLVPV